MSFLELNNIDRLEDYELAFETVVRALDYNTCKQILLNTLSIKGITIERLKEKFLEDRHLNNIYKPRHARGHGGVVWEWDIMGDMMLHNLKACIRFRLMSNCNRTSIAKQCARMVIKKEYGI